MQRISATGAQDSSGMGAKMLSVDVSLKRRFNNWSSCSTAAWQAVRACAFETGSSNDFEVALCTCISNSCGIPPHCRVDLAATWHLDLESIGL